MTLADGRPSKREEADRCAPRHPGGYSSALRAPSYWRRRPGAATAAKLCVFVLFWCDCTRIHDGICSPKASFSALLLRVRGCTGKRSKRYARSDYTDHGERVQRSSACNFRSAPGYVLCLPWAKENTLASQRSCAYTAGRPAPPEHNGLQLLLTTNLLTHS